MAFYPPVNTSSAPVIVTRATFLHARIVGYASLIELWKVSPPTDHNPLPGHRAQLRVSVQSKCSFEMWDQALTDESFGPSLFSGFETKDRCVKCPGRTHRIEIFS